MGHLILFLGWLILGIQCLAWGLVALVLYPLLPARIGRKVGRLGAMWTFRTYLSILDKYGVTNGQIPTSEINPTS